VKTAEFQPADIKSSNEYAAEEGYMDHNKNKLLNMVSNYLSVTSGDEYLLKGFIFPTEFSTTNN
jgi:hypothetical protein